MTQLSASTIRKIRHLQANIDSDTPANRKIIAEIIAECPLNVIKTMLPEFRAVAKAKPSPLVKFFVAKCEDKIFDEDLLQLAAELGVPDEITAPLRSIAASTELGIGAHANKV